MKSFDDVLNTLADSHYDMRVLVSKWAEMLNPIPAKVKFEFFDGTVAEIENFASIRKNIEDAISNYGKVALMTSNGAEDVYNADRLLIGAKNQPYISYSERQIQAYRQRNAQNSNPGNFGLNVAQVWGSSAASTTDSEIGAIGKGDKWGMDSARTQGESYEVTGTGVFTHSEAQTPPEATGVWISPNCAVLKSGSGNAFFKAAHDGIGGKTEDGRTWEYGVKENRYVQDAMGREQWMPDTETVDDFGVTHPCEAQNENVNVLENVAYLGMSIKLTKKDTLTEIGDAKARNQYNLLVVIPAMFKEFDKDRINRIISASLFVKGKMLNHTSETFLNFGKHYRPITTITAGSFIVSGGETPDFGEAVIDMQLFNGSASTVSGSWGADKLFTSSEDWYSKDVFLFLRYVAFDNGDFWAD